MTRTMRGASFAAALLAGVLTLGACGNNDDNAGDNNTPTSATSEAAQHNDADVLFATQMILHHEQALEMAKMAGTSDERVKDLADRIEGGQQPEIETMTGWLEEWGEPAPGSGGHGGHDMGGMDDMGGGMMTDAQLAELGKAHGAMFDQMWVEMMISHHQGAVQMADEEIEAGSDSGGDRPREVDQAEPDRRDRRDAGTGEAARLTRR